MSRIAESCVLETVTPEIARLYLETNTKNYRPLNKKLVRRYAREMERGAWVNRHPDGIAFDWDSVLGNGQHRLAAVVLSGKTIEVWVHRGCDPKSFHVADRGRVRREADVIRVLGFRNDVDPRRVAAVASFMITGGGSEPLENVHDFALAHEDLIATFLLELARALPRRSEVVAAFCKGTLEFGETEVLECARRYAALEFRGGQDPLRVLHEKLVGSLAGGRSLSRVAIYRLSVAAIRASLTGKKVQVLRPATKDFEKGLPVRPRFAVEASATALVPTS